MAVAHRRQLVQCRLTPRGVSGLKSYIKATVSKYGQASHPSRGEWIEIVKNDVTVVTDKVSPLAG